METKKEYLMKYFLDYNLEIDECGEVTIKTDYSSKKFPDIDYHVSVYDDDKLFVLLPTRAARRIKKKFPEILEESGSSMEGIQFIFNEKSIKKLEEDLKLQKKEFPPDTELVDRFLKYKERKIKTKKKSRKRRKKHVV